MYWCILGELGVMGQLVTWVSVKINQLRGLYKFLK